MKVLQLPPNAWHFTANANSKYNNIDIDHATKVMSCMVAGWTWYQRSTTQRLPTWGSEEGNWENNEKLRLWGWRLLLPATCWHSHGPICSSDVGDPLFAYHKAHCIILTHGKHLLYFYYFIDNIYGIWIDNHTSKWEQFCKDINNFGILTWGVEKSHNKLTFLTQSHYWEQTNPYQDIPKANEPVLILLSLYTHSLSCIKGTVYGLVSQYYAQNLNQRENRHFIKMLYQHLLNRDWKNKHIQYLLLEVTSKIETRGPKWSNSSPAARSMVIDPSFTSNIIQMICLAARFKICIKKIVLSSLTKTIT